ncbi:MAG: RNA ligase family protein [Bacillota bacterium]
MEFEKYHKVKRLGGDENKLIFSDHNDEIVIQEKIDGGNFRFYIQDDKVIFGSRTRELDETQEHVKNFRRCIEFVRSKLKGKDLSDYNGLIFYGECCVKHTISYDWDKIPPFLGFDIKGIISLSWEKDKKYGYLPYDVTKEYFEELDLPMVPTIKVCKASEIDVPITDDSVPISEYALESSQDKKAEGIVFKNYDKQIFAKYVRDAFKEKNSKVFGGSPKYNKVDDTNNAEFIFKYVTNYRIEKIILKKLDDGNSLTMELMGELIRDVYLDVIEEEWREILTSNWKLDFKKLRRICAPRVRAVLEQMIENNYINQI